MQAYSQYIGEALIPLLGFYYWDWSWYFILLFYILDGLAKATVLHLKSNKILQTQGGKSARSVWKKYGILVMAMDLVVLVALHFMYIQNHPEFQFTPEIRSFLQHKEMGVAQGWILVPVVVLGVWLQYQFTFLKLKLHTKIQMSVLWKEHFRQRFIVLSAVLFGGIVHFFVQLPDVVFLWAAVALPFLAHAINSRFR